MTPGAMAVVVGAGVGWFAAQGVKTGSVRLLDVVAIGPLMIYAAANLYGSDQRFARLALAAVGAATITYNGRNYMAQGQWERIAWS